MGLPQHITFQLAHNEHKMYHLSAVEALADSPKLFRNKTSLERAIVTGELWSATWYPSFNISDAIELGAPTFKELLDMLGSYDEIKNTLIYSNDEAEDEVSGEVVKDNDIMSCKCGLNNCPDNKTIDEHPTHI